MGCGALVDYGKIKGVVIATPEGRGVVLCRTVVDDTGHRAIFDGHSVRAGLSHDVTAFDTSTAQHRRPGGGEMVPSVVLVDLRRSPEFPHPDD